MGQEINISSLSKGSGWARKSINISSLSKGRVKGVGQEINQYFIVYQRAGWGGERN